jgi:hypothetical protein
MTYKLSFRIRKIYFDQIVAGVKTVEFRAVKPFWNRRVLKASLEIRYCRRVIAVFLCGSAIHRREVVTVKYYPNSVAALGREPSEQGKADLGDGPVIGFHLGEIVKEDG